jgi:hypothetical protein
MAINLQALRQTMMYKYGASGSEFDAAFIDAVNRVSVDAKTDIGLEVAAITQITGELDIDDMYYPVWKEGVSFYIARDRQWAKEPEQSAERYYRWAIGAAQTAKRDEDEGTYGLESNWGS